MKNIPVIQVVNVKNQAVIKELSSAVLMLRVLAVSSGVMLRILANRLLLLS